MTEATTPKGAAAVPLSRQIAAAEREITMRAGGFPHMVRKGRMTQAEADDEMAACKAILATLRSLLGPNGTRPLILYFETEAARADMLAFLREAGRTAAEATGP